jgi:hypothetical protein
VALESERSETGIRGGFGGTFAALVVAFSKTGVLPIDCVLDSFCNSSLKHSAHTPLALTGVAHLLYFSPQVLQIAMARKRVMEGYPTS